MGRVYNFSAGPAVLPEEVLREAADEMLDYKGCGMSVMEMSHRSKAFETIIQEAEAYEAAVINKAQGDAERFLSVYNAYKNGRDVTTKRLYIETMENVLQNSDKVILDPSSKGGNVLPYLPLKAAKQ